MGPVHQRYILSSLAPSPKHVQWSVQVRIHHQNSIPIPPMLVPTEIDPTSIDVSRRNVSLNNLQERITIVPTQSEGPIFLPLFQYVRMLDAHPLSNRAENLGKDQPILNLNTSSRCATPLSTNPYRRSRNQQKGRNSVRTLYICYFSFFSTSETDWGLVGVYRFRRRDGHPRRGIGFCR